MIFFFSNILYHFLLFVLYASCLAKKCDRSSFRIFSNWSQTELSKIWDIFVVLGVFVTRLEEFVTFSIFVVVVVVNLGGSLR